MQCELKLTKAVILTVAKNDLKKIMCTALILRAIIFLSAYIFSCYSNHTVDFLVTKCLYVALIPIPILILIAYSQAFIACRNPVKLAEFKDEIKRAMYKKHYF